MSHEGISNEEVLPSAEHTAEAALQLIDLEAETFAGNFESPEQKKWVDGFAAVSRVLQYATTIPAASEGVSNEGNPS